MYFQLIVKEILHFFQSLKNEMFILDNAHIFTVSSMKDHLQRAFNFLKIITTSELHQTFTCSHGNE